MDLRRILLIEDDPNDARLTLTAFRQSGMANEVVWVKDGQEALDYLYATGTHESRAPGNPAVVLLDIKLPKIDGLQVLEKIKSDPDLKCLPVVMLTSSDQEADLSRSYDLGVNAYVVKPVGFPEFVAALKELGLFWAVVNTPPPGNPPSAP